MKFRVEYLNRKERKLENEIIEAVDYETCCNLIPEERREEVLDISFHRLQMINDREYLDSTEAMKAKREFFINLLTEMGKTFEAGEIEHSPGGSWVSIETEFSSEEMDRFEQLHLTIKKIERRFTEDQKREFKTMGIDVADKDYYQIQVA